MHVTSFPVRRHPVKRHYPFQKKIEDEDYSIAKKRPRRASTTKKKFIPGQKVDAFWHDEPYNDWFSAEVISVTKSKGNQDEIIHVLFDGEQDIWGLHSKYVRPHTSSKTKSDAASDKNSTAPAAKKKKTSKARANPFFNPKSNKKKFSPIPPRMGHIPPTARPSRPPTARPSRPMAAPSGGGFLRRKSAIRSRPPPPPGAAYYAQKPHPQFSSPPPHHPPSTQPFYQPPSSFSNPSPLTESIIDFDPTTASVSVDGFAQTVEIPNFLEDSSTPAPPKQNTSQLAAAAPRMKAPSFTDMHALFEEHQQEDGECCENWTEDEVCEWLEQNDFSCYENVAREAGIDGRLLKRLTIADLQQDLNIQNQADLQKLNKLIQTLE